MSYAVVLKGGPPWGFRIQGGKEFNEPISVAKVCIFTYLKLPFNEIFNNFSLRSYKLPALLGEGNMNTVS